MKTVKLFISILLFCAFALTSSWGMSAKSHRGTVLQALEILQKGNESQRWVYGFFNYHAQRNGTSAQATIADNGPAPDNFLDTVIGGWWIGYRYFVEVQFLTSIGFTSYWHFTSSYRPGKYGDRYSGYGYSVQPPGGFFGLNNIVKTLLYNQEVKSGSYDNARGLVLGLKDIFQIFTKDWLGLASDFYNGEKDSGWGIPGANDVLHDYQTQTSSTDPTVNGQYGSNGSSWRVPAGNWDDVQDTFFNPGANAGQFWYNQFTHNSNFDDIKTDTLKQIGYAMHWIADGSTPQHVWNTTDHNHTSFESYMDEQIAKGYKVSKDDVQALIEEFEGSDMTTYAQSFACDGGTTVTGTSCTGTTASAEVAVKNLKVNGTVDPTLYAAGDILRWLAEKAVTYDKVLSDDSEETFKANANKSLTLAVAGEILLLRKATADLYKKKQYSRIVDAGTAPAEGIWGYGTFTVNGVTYNQIR